MTKTAAVGYEVRWRKNSDPVVQWSTPVAVGPDGHVSVPGLQRVTDYVFEARAVSGCGAKSAWATQTFNLPASANPAAVTSLTAQSVADGVHLAWTFGAQAPDTRFSIERSTSASSGFAERVQVTGTAYTDPEPTGTTFYYRVRATNYASSFGPYSNVVSSKGVAVDELGDDVDALQTAVAEAQHDADTANAQLADIASDGILSPAEKPTVMRDYAVITTEQAGIDGQATAYGITTQKTAYDNAVTALTTYLGTLTTPTVWNDKSGNTTIVGATFRANFNAVYTARQVLLNAIYSAAKSLADTAQATANANTSLLQNAFFATGDLTGWTSTYGTFAFEKGMSGPVSGTSQYAKRVGNASHSSDVLQNIGKIPVAPGSVVKGSANIRGISANGTAGVRISWRNSSDSELSATANDSTLTGTFNFGATVVGTAPANATWAYLQGSVKSHTSGTYTFDNFAVTGGIDNLDQLPDGSTYGKVNASNLTGGNVDLSSSTIANKNLDYIPDGSIRIGGTQYASGLTVDNANFELSSDLPPIGWTMNGIPSATLAWATGSSAHAGSQSLSIKSTGALSGIRTTRKYKCSAGDVFVAQAWVAGSSVAPGYLMARWGSSSGTAPNASTFFMVPTGAGSWAFYSGQVQAPSGADSFTLYFTSNVAPATFWLDDIALGSVLNQSSIAPITWAGVRSMLSTSPITYSISGTTVTFATAAFTNYGGGQNVSYSAASGSVTQPAGTTVTYSLYFRDPTSAGGARTLHITAQATDLAAYPDIVYVGYATVAVASGGGGTSGGGSGGGGGGSGNNPPGFPIK